MIELLVGLVVGLAAGPTKIMFEGWWRRRTTTRANEWAAWNDAFDNVEDPGPPPGWKRDLSCWWKTERLILKAKIVLLANKDRRRT